MGHPPRQAAQGAAPALPAGPVDPRRQRRRRAACRSAALRRCPSCSRPGAGRGVACTAPTASARPAPYFAYGLASSFEAYADTRRNRVAVLDDAERRAESPAEDVTPQLRWYLDRIAAALPDDTADGWAAHPKVAATVDRVRELWCNGEKALVFCFYVETGRALRAHISRALRHEVIARAARRRSAWTPPTKTQCSPSSSASANGSSAATRAGYDAFRPRSDRSPQALDDDIQEQVAEVVIRFMRTPSFLVRFVDLSPTTSVDDLLAGLEQPDMSGTTLADRIRAFADTLGQKVDVERDELLGALDGIQTGASPPPPRTSTRRSGRGIARSLLPNVRLANGGVRQETRRRLMLAFNTPFFPEVLVASSVMAEGVDLHQDCRHVIHHDLDWNPSTLEQRTGPDRPHRIEGASAPAARRDLRAVPRRDPRREDVPRRQGPRALVRRRHGRRAPEPSERVTEQQEARVPLPVRLGRAADDGPLACGRKHRRAS